jgi:hypothetical protein
LRQSSQAWSPAADARFGTPMPETLEFQVVQLKKNGH